MLSATFRKCSISWRGETLPSRVLLSMPAVAARPLAVRGSAHQRGRPFLHEQVVAPVITLSPCARCPPPPRYSNAPEGLVHRHYLRRGRPLARHLLDQVEPAIIGGPHRGAEAATAGTPRRTCPQFRRRQGARDSGDKIGRNCRDRSGTTDNNERDRDARPGPRARADD